MTSRALFFLANSGLIKQITKDQDFKRILNICDRLIEELAKSQININEEEGKTIVIKDTNEKVTNIQSDSFQKTHEKTRLAKILDEIADELKKISRDFKR